MLHFLLPMIPLTLLGAIFFKKRIVAYGFPVVLSLVKVLLTRPSPLFFVTVASLLLSVFLLRRIQDERRPSFLELTGYAASSVLIYELFSGFGVWLIGGCMPQNPPLYAHTAAGLLQCYFKALPYAAYHFLRDIPLTVLLVEGLILVEKKAIGAKLRLLRFQQAK